MSGKFFVPTPVVALGMTTVVIAAASCRGKQPSSPPTIVAAAPERVLPAPSCGTAVSEFTFQVDFQNPTEVRDDLVGECADRGWSADERRCVARAEGTSDLSDCVVTRARLIVANRDAMGDIGVADCDRVIARYRRCISTSLSTTVASDTQEALEITIASWRKQVAEDNERGWRAVQSQCSVLSQRIARTITRYGCER